MSDRDSMEANRSVATCAEGKSGGKLCCWLIVLNAFQQISPHTLASLAVPCLSVRFMIQFSWKIHRVCLQGIATLVLPGVNTVTFAERIRRGAHSVNRSFPRCE